MRTLRFVLLALLLSLFVGLVVGTAIRMRLERPVIYIGARESPATPPLLPQSPFPMRST